MQSTFPCDRQVDRLPTHFGLAEASMVFPDDIPGTVKVGVDLVSAGLAPKEGLRRAVAPMHIAQYRSSRAIPNPAQRQR
jgi:hypothetical protein